DAEPERLHAGDREDDPLLLGPGPQPEPGRSRHHEPALRPDRRGLPPGLGGVRDPAALDRSRPRCPARERPSRCGTDPGCATPAQEDRGRSTEVSAMASMTIERVSAFNALDVLVAQDEGLFAAEGLDLRIARLAPHEMHSTAAGTLAEPLGNQGR